MRSLMLPVGLKPSSFANMRTAGFGFSLRIVMTGVDPMAEFRGQYDSLKTSIKALRDIGEGDLEKTLDAKFDVAPVAFARRGDIAFFDGSAGIVAGRFAWFVSDDGLERVPLAYWEKAWRVGNG